MDIPWRNDGITCRWREDHAAELSDLQSMTPARLAEAITYCQTIYNPFSEELTRRAGCFEAFTRHGATDRERSDTLRRAAKAFGIGLY